MKPDQLERLAGVLVDGGALVLTESELDRHGSDFSVHPPRRPDAVVVPTTVGEVAAVLSTANELGIPVVPFGAGSSLEGHVIPVRGGVSLDLARLDGIDEISAENLTATVAAGVTRLNLGAAAREHGLQFPVDPGADATLGGMAATNASGTTTVRYGGMRRNVLALQVVLADGRVIRTGSRAVKTSAGYDLTSLFVGSEGTLGVIVELTVRLHPIDEAAVAVRATFPEVDAACRAAVALVVCGVSVTRAELLDAFNITAINRYSGTSLVEAPTLLVEVTGSRAAVGGDLEVVRDLLAEFETLEVVVERDEEDRRRLWRVRHDAAHAVMATAPGKRSRATDVCVPISRLPEAISHARETVERLGLIAGIGGHVADGNFHVAHMLDPEDPEDVRRARLLDEAVVEHALACGGTCTGEHGIGLGKREYLAREHPDLLPVYAGLKELLDPRGILNPGKIVE